MDVPIGTPILHLSALDPDGDTVTFALGSENSTLFSIDADSGLIRTVAALENGLTYEISAIATDGTLTDTLPLFIVVDADAAGFIRWITQSGNYHLDADSAIGVEVLTLQAETSSSSPITYSLDGNDAGSFAVDSSTGVVTTARAVTNGSTYFLVARASVTGAFREIGIRVVVAEGALPVSGAPDSTRVQSPVIGDPDPLVSGDIEGGVPSEDTYISSFEDPQVDGFHEYRERF